MAVGVTSALDVAADEVQAALLDPLVILLREDGRTSRTRAAWSGKMPTMAPGRGGADGFDQAGPSLFTLAATRAWALTTRSRRGP